MRRRHEHCTLSLLPVRGGVEQLVGAKPTSSRHSRQSRFSKKQSFIFVFWPSTDATVSWSSFLTISGCLTRTAGVVDAYIPSMSTLADTGHSFDHTPDDLLTTRQPRPLPQRRSLVLQLTAETLPVARDSIQYLP